MRNVVTMERVAYHGPDLPESEEQIILRLSDDWALGADRLQWMICRKKKRKGKVTWTPESFIASKLAVLRRVIAELGIPPSPEANAALHAIPDTFTEWLAGSDRREAA